MTCYLRPGFAELEAVAGTSYIYRSLDMGTKKAGSQFLRYSTYHSTTREKMVITPAYCRRNTTLDPCMKLLW